MDRISDKSLEVFTKPSAEWFARTFGAPTKVQQEAWPVIASGRPVLISAPTGTGKTLSAFLVFIDRLKELAQTDMLEEKLYLIYVSPLKSLAGDIRENLKRPLEGISQMDGGKGAQCINVGIRTGDTPQKDRQRMVKHPPHILITTPESLFLMLTSKSGQSVLHTAEALIIDELHALIDTKRGAHLMLSAARLDWLCAKPLQRIGLSATIDPLETAAEYLSPDSAAIVAPPMEKEIRIEVKGITPSAGRRRDPVWEDLAKKVYDKCQGCRSVIAFSEARRYAEKLAYYVNQLGGDDFARVHHGSMSKEQRAEVEASLRSGNLRLLCATSSMELGIDVGDIDQVLQVACPRSISSTMQRLGRAGHNPGRVSVMYMYPRTAPETLYCGMTAQMARQGGVERARPPRLCLDVLSQHLVSMAATSGQTITRKMIPSQPSGKKGESMENQEKPMENQDGSMKMQGKAGDKKGKATAKQKDMDDNTAYTIDDVMVILERSYPFRDVTRNDVKEILGMLSGDYEHSREIPVRPRLLYDRIHGKVYADSYSRMLAVAAGGTIPDKGMYTAKTEDGVKVGELDEEFVYESYLGDRFLLGAFAWKIVRQDKDNVVVTQTNAEGARLPFWKGETRGRDLATSLAFGKIMRRLSEAERRGSLNEELALLGLDKDAQENTADFLRRQLESDKILPDDRTIVIEHFTDSSGSRQAMIHGLFGRRVNAPLSLLLQHTAQQITGTNIGCVDEEDGILLYSYDEERIPEKLIYSIEPGKVRDLLESMLPATPVFNMNFRYNAARSLMMGMKRNGRQPLWMQRLRSTEMLETLIQEKNHPLIRETKRECLEDQWDIEGLLEILNAVRSGQIAVREIYLEIPSPMSLPMQWKVEAAEMYEYTPTTPGIRQQVYAELKEIEQLKPSPEELKKQKERRKLPDSADSLHSLLMMEGDVTVQELLDMYGADSPDGDNGERNRTDRNTVDGRGLVQTEIAGWLEELASRGLAEYIEPGLWIAAEHKEEYQQALISLDEESGLHIVRRMVYYRGYQTAEEIQERYLPDGESICGWLEILCERKELVEDEGVYYHGKLYDRARKATIRGMRQEAVTRPPENYAALMAGRVRINASPKEQLKDTLELYCGQILPVAHWENIVFPRRVDKYSEGLLDRFLAEGDYFWKMVPEGGLCFCRYEDVDWDAPLLFQREDNCEDENIVFQDLCKRGASFLKALTRIPVSKDVRSVLMDLAEKGVVCADSFIPVRQWLNKTKIQKAAPRQRVNARVAALSAGRWDVVHSLQSGDMETLLELLLRENIVLCRETFRRSLSMRNGLAETDCLDWGKALELLRVWEFTGRVRRGYFVKGLSGAQFIRKQDYEGVIHGLAWAEDEIIWLNAADPAQLWGKVLEHEDGRAFMNVPGTAVALKGGRPVMVLERQGRTLKVLEDMNCEEALREFAAAFKGKSLFPEKKRIIVKEYPSEIGDSLGKAGFIRELMDYVLYR
ncbi:MAG: DEAD/DEAH box helicase [Eubacteriales bacterium]|nr:DEAD/DEAH box helicase [Eubacteriales bacterium]